MMPVLSSHQVKDLIIKQLPVLIKKDRSVKLYIIELIDKVSAPKKQTEDRFEKLLKEIHVLRDEGNRKWAVWEKKWDENQRKWDEKWDENQRKWEKWEKKYEENQETIREMLKSIKKLDYRYDQGIGAIGERWGFRAEGSFRDALIYILRETSGYMVKHFEERDEDGYVFYQPATVELDVIIYNGKVIVAEIKASMSINDMVVFKRKTEWYAKHKNVKIDDCIVISPMISPAAKKYADDKGIRCFSYADDVRL